MHEHLAQAVGHTGPIWGVIDWFAGNGRYMSLWHCMGADTFWIAATVLLDVAVGTGYLLIAWHWARNQRRLPEGPPRRALASMRNIFLFCGVCGYAFIPIKMFWPAWRLYDLVMLALVYYTWRYAWNASDLKVIYRELGKSTALEDELRATRDGARKRAFFLNAVSHDLKTPLCAMNLHLEMAKLNLQDGDRQGALDSLEIIGQCATEANKMLQEFLELGRLDAAPEQLCPVRFDAGETVQKVVQDCTAEARRKGLTLRIDLPERLELFTDRVKLERVLCNLLSNAVKYTDRGCVAIRAVNEPRGGATFHVTDTGQGIAPADQEHIFDEFYQLQNRERDRRKGFGLGLAIARRLARHLGGDITVESKLGHGSRFTLELPDAAALRDHAAPVPAPASAVG